MMPASASASTASVDRPKIMPSEPAATVGMRNSGTPIGTVIAARSARKPPSTQPSIAASPAPRDMTSWRGVNLKEETSETGGSRREAAAGGRPLHGAPGRLARMGAGGAPDLDHRGIGRRGQKGLGR